MNYFQQELIKNNDFYEMLIESDIYTINESYPELKNFLKLSEIEEVKDTFPSLYLRPYIIKFFAINALKFNDARSFYHLANILKNYSYDFVEICEKEFIEASKVCLEISKKLAEKQNDVVLKNWLEISFNKGREILKESLKELSIDPLKLGEILYYLGCKTQDKNESLNYFSESIKCGFKLSHVEYVRRKCYSVQEYYKEYLRLGQELDISKAYYYAALILEKHGDKKLCSYDIEKEIIELLKKAGELGTMQAYDHVIEKLLKKDLKENIKDCIIIVTTNIVSYILAMWLMNMDIKNLIIIGMLMFLLDYLSGHIFFKFVNRS